MYVNQYEWMNPPKTKEEIESALDKKREKLAEIEIEVNTLKNEISCYEAKLKDLEPKFYFDEIYVHEIFNEQRYFLTIDEDVVRLYDVKKRSFSDDWVNLGTRNVHEDYIGLSAMDVLTNGNAKYLIPLKK